MPKIKTTNLENNIVNKINIDTLEASSQSEQLSIEVQKGDICKRTDINKLYINKTNLNTSMSDWSYIGDLNVKDYADEISSSTAQDISTHALLNGTSAHGLDTMSTQSSSNVSITGGTVNAQISNEISLIVGENVTAYNLLYIKNDGKLWRTDADVEASSTALFMALETKTANNTCKVSSPFPIITNEGWSWSSIGSPIFVSTSTGALTQTAPSGSADIVNIVGFALSATSIVFCPGYSYVEVA